MTEACSEEETKRCPDCGEIILAIARKCKHCQSILACVPASTVNREIKEKPRTPAIGILVAVIFVGIVLAWLRAPNVGSPVSAMPSSVPAVAVKEAEVKAAIHSSNDYSIHHNAFVKASSDLIGKGKCSLADFKNMGGWMRSTNHKPKSIYFTYCGGLHKNNRIYLNVRTGEVFR